MAITRVAEEARNRVVPTNSVTYFFSDLEEARVLYVCGPGCVRCVEGLISGRYRRFRKSGLRGPPLCCNFLLLLICCFMLQAGRGVDERLAIKIWRWRW